MARSAKFHVTFDMFVDRPGVFARVEAWKLRTLSRTGAYGMGVMRKQFRPPLTGKRSNSVTWNGTRYHVPRGGLILDPKTGRPVTTQDAQQIREAFWRSIKGRGAGKPPRRGPTDLLRRFTFFGMDPGSESVVVGPYPFKKQPPLVGAVSVPELLDKGGAELIGKQLVKYDPHPFVERTLPPVTRFMDKLIEQRPVGARRVA